MDTPSQIPEGYRQDARGNLIPEQNIRPIDQARDALVIEIARGAKALQLQMIDFKRKSLEDIAAFVELSLEQYRVNVGGKKGNVTLIAFCGRYKIIRQMQESIRFDERLQAAKVLIDQCLDEWTEGARPEVRAIVGNAFQSDHQGNIRTGQVLQLRRLKIDDPRWKRAMTAISDAVQVVGSKSYIRIYERDSEGQYQAISLDLASLPV